MQKFERSDVWVLMADANLALDQIKIAATYYSNFKGSDKLIDRELDDIKETPPQRSRGKDRTRACPAAFVCPADKEPIVYPTVFEMVIQDEERKPADVQWAIMTLIAINSTFRENVAMSSSAPAAKLVREMPARFERYLMGTDTTETMTPYEAVCDFTSRVQLVYAGIEKK